jgi:hypothetical protein
MYISTAILQTISEYNLIICKGVSVVLKNCAGPADMMLLSQCCHDKLQTYVLIYQIKSDI